MISNIYPVPLFSKPLHESLYFSLHLRDVLKYNTCVTPPGPHHHTERVSNLGCWRGRRALQPQASVAKTPVFEVRGVRFTHSPYWHTSVTHACTVCGFKSPFLVISWLNWQQTRVQFFVHLFMMTWSGRAPWVTADRTGKIVLLTYSLTASRFTEAHLTRAWRWGKAAVHVWKVSLDVDAKKHTGSAP